MFRAEAPDLLAGLGFDAVDKSVCRADEDVIICNSRGGNRSLAEAESPDSPAVARVEAIQCAIHRRKVKRLPRNDRRGGNGALGLEAPFQRPAKINGVEIAALISEIDQVIGYQRRRADFVRRFKFPDTAACVQIYGVKVVIIRADEDMTLGDA